MIEETKNIEQNQPDIERESALRVLQYAELEMRKTAPVLLRLLQKRHELFEMAESEITKDMPVDDQLYEDPFYNDTFSVSDLRVRTGPQYLKMKESFDPVLNSTDDEGNPTPQRDDTEAILNAKKEFRQSILAGGQELGYVSKYAGTSENELDRKIGVLPSTLEKIGRPVDALVIAGAAGISNLIRVHDALRNVESGAVETDTIIFAAGERTAAPHERPAAQKLGYRGGDTEFEQAITAFEDLGGVQFEDEVESVPAPYGNGDIPNNKVKKGQMVINGKVLKIIVVEGTYDRNRRDAMSGNLADRSITSETFQAVAPFLTRPDMPVLIGSHDTWGKGQEIVAQEVFGLESNKEVIGTWAFKSDRVIIGEDGEPDIMAAQAVVDEIGKTHFNLVRLKTKALNKLESLKDAT